MDPKARERMKRDAKELLRKLEKASWELNDVWRVVEGFQEKGTDGAYEGLKDLAKHADDVEWPVAGTLKDLVSSADIDRRVRGALERAREAIGEVVGVMDEVKKWAGENEARVEGKEGDGVRGWVDVEFGK